MCECRKRNSFLTYDIILKAGRMKESSVIYNLSRHKCFCGVVKRGTYNDCDFCSELFLEYIRTPDFKAVTGHIDCLKI